MLTETLPEMRRKKTALTICSSLCFTIWCTYCKRSKYNSNCHLLWACVIVLFIVRKSTAETTYLSSKLFSFGELCTATGTRPVDTWHFPFRPWHFDAKNSIWYMHEHEYRQQYQQQCKRMITIPRMNILREMRSDLWNSFCHRHKFFIGSPGSINWQCENR